MLIPLVPNVVEQATPFAALVKFSGATRLWQGQSLTIDGFQTFAALAGAGLRVPCGVGVSLMPLRHPFEAALQARSVAAVTGEPFVAGFGPGAPGFRVALGDAPYLSPLTAAREYLEVARGLLAGERVTAAGRYVGCDAALPALPAPPVELGLGVLRPNMARLAGAVADVAITWLAPASYLQGVVAPALQEGADGAGRVRPRLVAMVPVALTRRDHPSVRVALAGSAPHLQAPHYLDMLTRAGLDVRSDDLVHTALAALEGQAIVIGDLDEVLDRLGDFKAAGVDELVLNTTGVANLLGPTAALDDLGSLVARLA